MIVFSAFLVVVAVALLVAGAVTSKLWLVYLAIGVSGVSLLALGLGAILRRDQLFGKARSAELAQPPPVPAQVPAAPRGQSDLDAFPEPASAPAGYRWSAAAQLGPPRAGYLPSDQSTTTWPPAANFPPAVGFPELQTGFPEPQPGFPERQPVAPAAGPPATDRSRPAPPGRPAEYDRPPAAFTPIPPAGTPSPAPGAWQWRDTLPPAPPPAPAPPAPALPPAAAPAPPTEPQRPAAVPPAAFAAAAPPAAVPPAAAAAPLAAAAPFALPEPLVAPLARVGPSGDQPAAEDLRPAERQPPAETDQMTQALLSPDHLESTPDAAPGAHTEQPLGGGEPEGPPTGSQQVTEDQLVTPLLDEQTAAEEPGAAAEATSDAVTGHQDTEDHDTEHHDSQDQQTPAQQEPERAEPAQAEQPEQAEQAEQAEQSTAPAEPDLLREVTVVPGVPRYHNAQCILIRFMAEDDLNRMPLAEARQAGCTPCRACQPDQP